MPVAEGIVRVSHRLCSRESDRRQAVQGVIRVGCCPRSIHHLDAVARCIITVSNRRTIRVANAGQVVQGIVDIGGQLALGIGHLSAVAYCIIIVVDNIAEWVGLSN